MKILALYDLEDVAVLLTDLTMITEVDVISVPTVDRFKQFLDKGKFNAIYVLDKFFAETADLILSHDNAPPAVLIFVTDEDAINKYLRIGISDLNIETIPFNPLTLFVKTRSLLETLQKIELLLKEKGNILDFYRHGLFNVLNILAKKKESLFLSIKDLEEEKILYTLRIRNGQVMSANRDIEEIVKVNVDDALPKAMVIETVQYEDKALFKGTADFYRQLLEFEIEVEETEATPEVTVVPPTEKPQKVVFLKENAFREKRVYKFPYKDWIVYSHPLDTAKGSEDNALFCLTLLNEQTVGLLRGIIMKRPSTKFITSPIIKGKLIGLGIPSKNFVDSEEITAIDLPFLGNKYECAIFFPNGYTLTGNLFGSYVTKESEYLERVFMSHFKIFHQANISSNERLKKALNDLKSILKKSFYILPHYGYAVNNTIRDTAINVLENLDIPLEYSTLSTEWSYLSDTYGINARDFEDFIRKLTAQNSSVLFSILDDMEVLGIVPLEI
jgi:hypothetical protein